MKEETILTHMLGASPKIRLVELLLVGRDFDYCISDLAEHAGVGRTTIYRMLDGMIKSKFITPTRKIGRIQLYKLNKDNSDVKLLIKMFDELLKTHSDLEIERQTLRVKAARN